MNSTANPPGSPLDAHDLEKLFDQAADELRWQFLQQTLVSDPDAEPTDVPSNVGKAFPAFGSEKWLKTYLVKQLARLKLGLDEIDNEYRASGPHIEDFDEYVHLNLPSRHRKLGRLLAELAVTHPWLDSLLDPRDERKARLIVTALRTMGIDASYTIRYRDLGEERTYP